MGISIIDKLGTQVMALGGNDFQLGSDFWRKTAEGTKINFITSNLVNSSTGETFFKPYHIEEIAGVRIGILSAMPETALVGIPKDAGLRPFNVVPPGERVAQLVNELKDQTDFIILMSQCKPAWTHELLKTNPDLDMAICRYADLGFGEIQSFEDVPERIAFSGIDGTEVGYYRLGFDESKKVVVEDSKTIILDDKTTNDPEIQAMIEKAFPEIQQ